MTNYYYAKEAETRFNHETGKEELMLKVPVRVNPETADCYHEKVYMVRIGWKEYLCRYIWIPATYYLQYKRDLENEAKADERDHRCNIPDGKGGTIKCPEKNRCATCKKCLKSNFDNLHDTSLDGLLETGFDPESGAETESDFDVEDISLNPEQAYLIEEEKELMDELGREIISRLQAVKPKYALIFGELLKGVDKPAAIARNTGVDAKRVYEDVPRVQKLAAQLYAELNR